MWGAGYDGEQQQQQQQPQQHPQQPQQQLLQHQPGPNGYPPHSLLGSGPFPMVAPAGHVDQQQQPQHQPQHQNPNQWCGSMMQGVAPTPPNFAVAVPPPSAPITGGSDGAHEALVRQVKELQRRDPTAKDQWVAYTDLAGNGRRDPSKHNSEFLQGFIVQFTSGTRLPVHEDAGQLCEFVKILQRKSNNFKGVWAQYCFQYGGGTGDPHKHDNAYHVRFFDFLSKQASESLSWSPPAPPAAGGSGFEAPQKRMRDNNGQPWATGGSWDPEKDYLVAQVKNFQRLGEQQKELWGMYADMYLGGVRDPARHDAATLQEFCVNHHAPPPTDSGPGGSPCGGGGNHGHGGPPGGGGGGGGVAPPLPMDPMKEALVAKVKNYQRGGKDQAEIWNTFAGITRDPARHENSKLQEFISMYCPNS